MEQWTSTWFWHKPWSYGNTDLCPGPGRGPRLVTARPGCKQTCVRAPWAEPEMERGQAVAAASRCAVCSTVLWFWARLTSAGLKEGCVGKEETSIMTVFHQEQNNPPDSSQAHNWSVCFFFFFSFFPSLPPWPSGPPQKKNPNHPGYQGT